MVLFSTTHVTATIFNGLVFGLESCDFNEPVSVEEKEESFIIEYRQRIGWVISLGFVRIFIA